jgi:hypothetical protein
MSTIVSQTATHVVSANGWREAITIARWAHGEGALSADITETA